MIKHIVLWKLKEEAEGNSSANNALEMKRLLEALPALIPELESVEVGIQMFDTKDAAVCDIVLIATCEDEKALQTYAAHPEHVKVVEFIKKVVSERRVVDYLA